MALERENRQDLLGKLGVWGEEGRGWGMRAGGNRIVELRRTGEGEQ